MISKWSQTFSFVKRFRLFFIISLLLCAVGIVSLLLLPFGVNLFNFDIDFVGGTTMTFEMHMPLDRAALDEIADVVASVTGEAPAPPQKTGTDGTQVFIRTRDIDSDTRDQVFEALKTKYNLADGDRLLVENISPAVGRDLQQSAIVAVLLATVLILLYITVRFTFSSGLAAVVALVHDLLITLSVYVIFRIPMNMNFIAVMLTILGYSINATIIVFDRVRENGKLMTKTPFNDVVDRSIWQTLTRNINTTLTTLLPIVLLIILGVSSVRNFVIPLAVGILSGAYSSICFSGPLWSKIKKS